MSLDMNSFLANVKRAAVEAVKAGKPFSLTYGTVVSASPLKISVNQKLILNSEQLILTNAVRNFSVAITADLTTEDVPEDINATRYTVNLALKPGEQVIMLRTDGGQKFIVLDRVEAPNDT